MRWLDKGRVLSFVVLLAPMAACAPRSNPAVSEVIVERGQRDPVELSRLAFAYDEYRPVQVTRIEGDDEEIWELVWDGETLRSFSHLLRVDGIVQLDERSVVTTRGGRVQQVVTDAGDRVERTTTFAFAAAHLTEIGVQTVAPGGATRVRKTFTHDGNGALIAIATMHAIDDEEEDGPRSAIRHQGDKPVGVVTTDAQQGTTENIGAAYEEGRVKTFTRTLSSADGEGDELRSAMDLTYDAEGRIGVGHLAAPDEEGTEDPLENDRFVRLGYNDGAAVGIDVTPRELIPFPLWDLAGHGAASVVEETQLVRITELRW